MESVVEISSASLAPSKSLLNRALVVQSFFPDLKLRYNENFLSEDVLHLRKSLLNISNENVFDCGEGAAPLRFLAIRLSRLKGRFEIYGSERLLSRPHDSLVGVLEQLGCRDICLTKSSLCFESSAKWPSRLTLSTKHTSQVYSALLLSSWQLESDLEIHFSDKRASESYAQMTELMLRDLGLDFEKNSNFVQIKSHQEIKKDDLLIEPDMSCAATVAALGLVKKGVVLRELPEDSLQGDRLFFELLPAMGADFLLTKKEHKKLNITIFPSLLVGIDVNLSSTPDLFPVLAALASRAISKSSFRGLENLNIKESPRLDRMNDLLFNLGVPVKIQKDQSTSLSFEVSPDSGRPSVWPDKLIRFSPDQDHRLAMAAALLMLTGAPLEIDHPECVKKSFPNFWDIYKEFAL